MVRSLREWIVGVISMAPLATPAQCGYPAAITSSKDYCIGATLRVSSPHGLGKIVWYANGVPMDSAMATSTLNPNGITVAGSGAQGGGANQFRAPYGIDVDEAGNLYVCDEANSRVQKYAPGASSGITVAGGNGEGSGPDQLTKPQSIHVDRQGDLYVSDAGNNRILEFAPGSTTGRTVLTLPPKLLGATTGLYVDCDGNIYLPDLGGDAILRYAPGASPGTIVAGGNGNGSKANQLSYPTGVALDGRGDLFVLDAGNRRVQEWAPGATTGTTVADIGSLPGTIVTVDGMWVGGSGAVYLSCYGFTGVGSIAEFTPGSAMGQIILGNHGIGSGANQFAYNWDVVMDVHGSLYVSDITDEQVRKFQCTSSIDSTYTPTTPGKYWAVVTDLQGFPMTTDTVPINTPNAGNPSIQITASRESAPVCVPISFTATAQNVGVAPFYQWEVSGVPVGGDSLTYGYNLFANGDQVECILTTQDGCTADYLHDTSNVIALAIDPAGAATVTIDASKTAICKGDAIDFMATVVNAATNPAFAWLVNGDTVSGVNGALFQSDSLTNGAIVTCMITSDDACGLAKSNSIPVMVNVAPVIAPGEIFTIPYGESLRLEPQVTGAVASWLWEPAAYLSDSTIEDPLADPPTNETYSLIATAAGGCADTAAITVNVYTPLSLPNAFTPNGDGHNDVFYVLGGPENSEVESFTVFDRWGRRVFGVEHAMPGDRSAGWDGRIGGVDAPVGVYVYLVVVRYATGARQEYKGTVVLVR